MISQRPNPPTPEHGDWRVPLQHPEEAEHLPPHMTVWHRTRLIVEQLQTAPVGYPAAYAQEDDPGIIPISGWARFLRLLMAWFLLLPISVVMVHALLLQLYRAGDTVGQLSFWTSVPVWYSLLGVGTFAALMVVRIVNPILIYIYVLGHELTHALAAIISMGKVQRMSIDLSGGYVETDKDNLFIALSPYFVPLWMGCWMLILWVANWVHPFPEWAAWFYAGLGFWWSFHLYWTVWVIPREQPDMLENGLLFSLLIVMIMNIAILLVALCFFGVVSPAGYAHDLLAASQQIFDCACALYAWLQEAKWK